jgi:hypothetical protein
MATLKDLDICLRELLDKCVNDHEAYCTTQEETIDTQREQGYRVMFTMTENQRCVELIAVHTVEGLVFVGVMTKTRVFYADLHPFSALPKSDILFWLSEALEQ